MEHEAVTRDSYSLMFGNMLPSNGNPEFVFLTQVKCDIEGFQAGRTGLVARQPSNDIKDPKIPC